MKLIKHFIPVRLHFSIHQLIQQLDKENHPTLYHWQPLFFLVDFQLSLAVKAAHEKEVTVVTARTEWRKNLIFFLRKDI